MNITSKLAAASLGLLVISSGTAAYAEAGIHLSAATHASAQAQAQLHRPDLSVVGKAKQTATAAVGATEASASRVRGQVSGVVTAKTTMAASMAHRAAASRPRPEYCGCPVQVAGHAGARAGARSGDGVRTPAESTPPSSSINSDPSGSTAPSRGSDPERSVSAGISGSASISVSGSASRPSTGTSDESVTHSGVAVLASLFSTISAQL
ncbi:MAG: hypothetical protein ACYCZV_09090 [Acidimicrobiales bacterium]